MADVHSKRVFVVTRRYRQLLFREDLQQNRHFLSSQSLSGKTKKTSIRNKECPNRCSNKHPDDDDKEIPSHTLSVVFFEKSIMMVGSSSTVVCSSPGCNKVIPSNLACPKCIQLGLPPTYFCSQECFRTNYATHKQVHNRTDKPILNNIQGYVVITSI